MILHGSTSDGATAWDATAPYEVVRAPTSVSCPGHCSSSRVLRTIDERSIDAVVFGAAFPLGLLARRIRRRTGLPVPGVHPWPRGHLHASPAGPLPLRLIGRRAAAITFVSHWCEHLLRPAFGPGPRYDLLPPASTRLTSSRGSTARGPSAPRARRRAGGGVRVAVGRTEGSGHTDPHPGRSPSCRSRDAPLIVGDGPHRETLEHQARQRGVSDAVVFTGTVGDEELPAHYAAGDVFAMPCRNAAGARGRGVRDRVHPGAGRGGTGGGRRHRRRARHPPRRERPACSSTVPTTAASPRPS